MWLDWTGFVTDLAARMLVLNLHKSKGKHWRLKDFSRPYALDFPHSCLCQYPYRQRPGPEAGRGQRSWTFFCSKLWWCWAPGDYFNISIDYFNIHLLLISVAVTWIEKQCSLTYSCCRENTMSCSSVRCVRRCWHQDSAWACMWVQPINLSWRNTEWLPSQLRNAAKASPSSKSLSLGYFSKAQQDKAFHEV